MNQARVLFFDFETAPKLIYAWGDWEQNAIATKRYGYMISFAWKWLGEKKTHVRTLPDYKLYKKEPFNDRELVKELWGLLNSADVVVAHNARRFDCRKVNSRFVFHNMKPPKPYLIHDTLEVAKKHFAFDSNKLDSLGDYLGVGRKVTHTGAKLWLDCEAGDMKAWKLMGKYNIGDVDLLERVYHRLKVYTNTHPNIALINGVKKACPVCGSKKLTRHFEIFTRVTAYPSYQCDDCGAWSKDTGKENSQVR